MTRQVQTLDQLRTGVWDEEDRVIAATEYIRNGEAKIAEARTIRDRAVLVLVEQYGPAETARMTGLNVNTIKVIARGRRR